MMPTGGGGDRRPNQAFVASPFTRLARTHTVMVAGDALVALALAGSLFFSIDPSAARWRVALYLVLTMAPFAVVAPLIGPVLDRAPGGRRWSIVGSGGLRAIIGFLMIGNLDSLLLFPLAFIMLVLGKGYQVARSALVPTTVRSDRELVEANSKLSLLSGLAGAAAVVPGVILLQLGPEWTVGLATIVFVAGTVAALQLPSDTVVATEPADEAEKAELRSAGIVLAVSAMGMLRGLVGFLMFLLAFDLRGGGDGPSGLGATIGDAARPVLEVGKRAGEGGAPTWHFGVVVAFAGLGGVLGAALAQPLRRVAGEEQLIVGSLAGTVVLAIVAVLTGGLFGAAVMALTIAMAAALAKLAFDSIVQRDAPDANRGRSFARFEARFQLIWVIGAFVPVVIPLPARLGYAIVAIAAGSAAMSYVLGRRSLHADPSAGGRYGRLA